MPVREIKTVEEFNKLKKSKLKYILLYFYGSGCSPCETLSNTIKNKLIKKEYQNVTIYKINGPKLKELMNYYNFNQVPHIIFLDVENDTREDIYDPVLNISKVEEKMKLIKNSRNDPNIGELIQLEDDQIIPKSGDRREKFLVVILDDNGNELKFSNKKDLATFITNNSENFKYLAGGACDVGKPLPYINVNDKSKINKEELEKFIEVVNNKVKTVTQLL